MKRPRATHLLMDFFGTLVDYSPSRTEQGFHASHGLVHSMGAEISYSEFLHEWAMESSRLDKRSDVDDSEFSMDEVAIPFLSRLLSRSPTTHEVTALVETYVGEWNSRVTYPTGSAQTVRDLASRLSLAVVTNTHWPDLVPRHLAAMGLTQWIEAVVTSVEVGWRKSHPAIYAEALRRLGIDAASAVFVGDNFTADYLGPQTVGITAFLIDPTRKHRVDEDRRLRSLSDLPGALDLFLQGV